MSKKKIIIILSILVIVVAIISLYGTFATNSTVDATSSATYGVTLTNSTSEVTMPASSSKTIYYKLSNTNKGTVKYGVAYSGTNITVKIYSDSNDPETGLINYGENKFIKLYIQNTSTTDSTATITTILGYENGGDLIVPTGKALVTEVYIGNAVKYITSLFVPNTTAVNNSITYNYDTTNNLMQDTQGNIRYYGASPNNYIYFNCDAYPSTNCELWRIIGVVDGKLKLIRNESIGDYSWDTSLSGINSGSGVNEWRQADLMKLLNPGYEREDYQVGSNIMVVNNSLYWNSQSGNCFNGQNNATTTCDFTSTGLKNDTTRNMISDSTYYLGGGSNSDIYSNASLTMERGTTVINNPSDGITRTTSWTGKIGLMYPSDYGYATDFTKCSQTLYNYDSSTDSYACRTNDWLYNGAGQWLLTPNSLYAYHAWIVGSPGSVVYGNAVYVENGVRPVLNLDSVLGIESGSGTESNPYRISA